MFTGISKRRSTHTNVCPCLPEYLNTPPLSVLLKYLVVKDYYTCVYVYICMYVCMCICISNNQHFDAVVIICTYMYVCMCALGLNTLLLSASVTNNFPRLLIWDMLAAFYVPSIKRNLLFIICKLLSNQEFYTSH